MSGVPIARLFGFEIRVHLSWAIVLAVIAVTVAAEIRGPAFGVAGALGPLAGAAVAALFLGSAIIHELAHAIVARRAGMRLGPIVVYFFGGGRGR